MKKLIVTLFIAVGFIIITMPEVLLQAQPFPATYCCDSWGSRRCAINPSILGSTCFCYGQGYGYACY